MKPIAISLGDPAGIGAEVVEKALVATGIEAWVFGSQRYAGKISAAEFIDIPASKPLRRGEIDAEYGRVALASLDAAVDAVERGQCSALVTAPIHKQSIALAGSPWPGHTEILAARAGLKRYAWDYAMYFDSPKLRTVLLSVHESLRNAIWGIEEEKIAALARLTARSYEQMYGTRPSIAVAGVNPHAGEGGMFGAEEATIAKGVEIARKDGIEITGPHAADTVFLSAIRGRFDVVMSMYHDQGLIAIKSTAFEQSVNLTLGLPYLRVSVDHGTAFDIAGQGIADATPMQYALEWAAARAESFRHAAAPGDGV